MVTVVVTDAGIGGKGKLSAERDVVVTVTNVNEPVTVRRRGTSPVVTLTSLVPKVGVPLTATLDDPDGGEKDIEWQWRITGAVNTGVPGMPNATGDGAISGAESATYTPKINDVGGLLTATVMYADAVGSGQDWHCFSGQRRWWQDLAAKAPVFKPKPASRSVPENYATGDEYGGTGGAEFSYRKVGAVVIATDPNDDKHDLLLGRHRCGSILTSTRLTGQIMVKDRD